MKDGEHFFKGKLKIYEKKIVNFLIDDAYMNGGDLDKAEIYTCVLLHRSLTQNELANITNFPKSKISKLTSNMIENGKLQKKIIQGTHTNRYFITKQLEELNNISRDLILKKFKDMTEYFQDLINQLEIINDTSKKGKTLLLFRIIDFYRYAKICSNIIIQHREKGNINNFQIPEIEIDSVLKQDDKETMYIYLNERINTSEEIIEFNPETKKIEEKFHSFLKHGVFKKEKKSLQKVIAYFISRGKLTQKKLQNLTQLSAGTISQNLSYFLHDKKIKLVPNSKSISIEKFYYLSSISRNLFEHHQKLYKNILTWKKDFIETKNELNSPSNEMLLLEGYYPIYTIVDKILSVYIPRYERRLKEQEFILNLLKEKKYLEKKIN